MCRNGAACGCGSTGAGSGVALAVALAVPAVALGALVVFIAAHSAEVAAAVAVFATVIGWLLLRWRRRYGQLPPGVLVTARPARGVRAVTAAPKAIGGRRVVAAEVLARAESETMPR